MVGVLDVAAEHAVLHLRRRLVHGILVGVVEGVEEPDELVAFSRLHAEIIDVEVVAVLGQGFERHGMLRRSRLVEDDSAPDPRAKGGARSRDPARLISLRLPERESGTLHSVGGHRSPLLLDTSPRDRKSWVALSAL